MNIDGSSVVSTNPSTVELERLGGEIAELAAHLDAATSRLLGLIRESDARGQDEDGMVIIRVRLAQEAGAVVMKALEAGREALYRRRQPTDVPAGTSQRLACDASRVVMRHDADGRITEVGARTRTVPPALRRALQHRDEGCGGPTTLSNLALLCRRHHRAVHDVLHPSPGSTTRGA